MENVRIIAGSGWVDSLGKRAKCVWLVDGPDRQAALTRLLACGYQPTISPTRALPAPVSWGEQECDRPDRLALDVTQLERRPHRGNERAWQECAAIDVDGLRFALIRWIARWRALGRSVGYAACGIETGWPWGHEAAREDLACVDLRHVASVLQPDRLVSLVRDNRILRWSPKAEAAAGACKVEINRRFAAGEFRGSTFLERAGCCLLKVGVDQLGRVTVRHQEDWSEGEWA